MIPEDSWTDGTNQSIMSSYLCKSWIQVVIISLSERIPNARKRINKGTGFLTFGTLTTRFRLEYFAFGFTNLTERVRIGLDTFSETERILAVHK